MFEPYLSQIHQPQSSSHKGQNGKVLIVGGSELFHAASQWSFQVISRWVDMTFYSSVSENNKIIEDAKFYAHDGVVVPRSDIPAYALETDVILIGPGLRRDVESRFSEGELETITPTDLTPQDWQSDTRAITTILLREFPEKKWVIDAGALQVLQVSWLPQRPILTPHMVELEKLIAKIPHLRPDFFAEFSRARESLIGRTLGSDPQPVSAAPQLQAHPSFAPTLINELHELSKILNHATLIVKGPVDIIWDDKDLVAVSGGNAAMTKGGTGDVLAGIISAFWSTSPSAFASVVIASALNKHAGHDLWREQGLMYNTTDLVNQLPKTWKTVFTP